MVHELYAYLRVSDSARAIDFYRQAFGASEKFRLTEPSGRIGHRWMIGHKIEKLTPQEMQRRYAAMMQTG